MKAWAVMLKGGRLARDGVNDVTCALFRVRRDAGDWVTARVVRVEVTVHLGKGQYNGWAVKLARGFARDGLNDVTPALFPTRRAAEAWGVRGEIVRVGVDVNGI